MEARERDESKSDVEQLEGILSQFRDDDLIVAAKKRGIHLTKEVKRMEKHELAKTISARLKIDEAQAELAVNEVIAELVSPYILKRPGEEVALLDNSCTNNCRPAEAISERRAGR